MSNKKTARQSIELEELEQANNQQPKFNNSDFRNQIENKLIKLSNYQYIVFARRCALYALPYLFTKGNMNFWEQSDKLTHTYVIFNALDYCHFNVKFKHHYSTMSDDVFEAAFAAAHAAEASNAESSKLRPPSPPPTPPTPPAPLAPPEPPELSPPPEAQKLYTKQTLSTSNPYYAENYNR